MFLSGNEVYWHTRLEASIDGSATPNRTIVCYKDSWESSKIDPGEGTPTWRDPAQPAPAGSQPENALTGTMYMSNDTDLAITVSAAQGKARLWRNTSLASLPAGTTQTLAPHTIGYESDEDVDNGHRPPGPDPVDRDHRPDRAEGPERAGTQVAPGTTTHSLTLYRAASGALVFGAGTIQWGWGLDQYHDGDNSNPADPRMQQATLNMLADMGAVPTTLMSGLVAADGLGRHLGAGRVHHRSGVRRVAGQWREGHRVRHRRRRGRARGERRGLPRRWAHLPPRHRNHQLVLHRCHQRPRGLDHQGARERRLRQPQRPGIGRHQRLVPVLPLR